MSVKFNTRQIGDVVVVDAGGRIVVDRTARTLGDAIRELMGTGHLKVVVNLADVSYIDSAGVGELVATLTSIINRGGSMKLLNANERMRNILRVTKLHAVFQIFDDEATAVSSFVG